MNEDAQPPRPFLLGLRSMGCLVKGALVVAVLVVTSPFLFGAAYMAHVILGEAGPVLVLGAIVAATGWFLFTSPFYIEEPAPPRSPAQLGEETGTELAAPRRFPGSGGQGYLHYCASCGEVFAESACPTCGRVFKLYQPHTVAELAAILNDLTSLAGTGAIPSAAYRAVRDQYEARLEQAREQLRPAPAAPAPAPPPPPAAHAPAMPPPPAAHTPAMPPPPAAHSPAMPPPPAAHAPAMPPPPAAHVPVFAAATPALQTAQAVSRQPAPPPPAAAPAAPPEPPGPNLGQLAIGWAAERQADLLLYAGAFLVSIAAIIFVAYQGETLSGTTRFAILTFYAVAFLVMGLTLSRWERVREAGPVFLALGAVLVPVDFVALRTQVLHDDVSIALLWLLGSASTSVLYLALALRGYGRLYFIPAGIAIFVTWSALGATLDVPWQWWGPWYATFAALAYIGSSAFMTRWRALSAVYVAAIVIGISALLWVQAGYAEPGYDKLALPLTYAIATLAVVVGLRWRVNEATLATLPALGTMTAATAWWAAAGIPDEWKPAWLALGANGYLVVAHVRARGQEQAWAAVAACGAAVALFMAHALVVSESADHAALPATHVLVLAGVSAAYLRWRWVEAAALLPAAVAATAGTAWWAAWGLADEWRPMVAIVAGAGYLVLAHLEGRGREQAWAATALAVATLGIVLEHALVTVDGASHWPLATAYAAAGAGLATVYARWRWFEAGALLPPVVAMAAWVAWWADRGMPDEWRPLGAVAAAAGYLLLAHLEGRGRERTWAALALGGAALGIAVTHPLVLVEDASRWPLAIGYGAAAAGVATVYARWRWFEAGALLPPVVAMAAWAAWWADRGMPDEWRPLCAIAAAAGYLLLAHLERRGRERTWAALGLAFAVTAIAFEHVLTPVEGADRAPLPLAYAALFVGLSSAYGRWRWVEAATLMPPAGAMAIASTAWASDAVAIEWYATVVAGAALGYLALAFIDGPMRRSGWQFAAAVTGALAVGMSAVTPAFEDPNRWAMPVPADLLLAGALAAFARFRWRWRVAPAAIPALAAFAAASASWANWDLAVEWYAPFASAAAAGYLLLGHFEDRPFQGRWARAAILISLAAIVVPQFAVTLPESADRWSLVCVYGGAAAVALAAALRWRWRLPEAFAVAPPALAATGAALWAAVDMPLDWLGAWAAAAAVGYAAIAPWAPGRTGIRWRLAGAASGALALVVAHAFVNSHDLEEVSRLRFQLPITYAILLVGATWDGARWRDGGLFVAPVLGATTGFATLWAAGVDAAWAPFPALAIAALLIATAPWWLRQRGPDVGGWAYTVAFAALPTLLFLPHNLSHAPQGLASQVISAALLAVAAFRTKGGVSQFFARTSPIYPEGERSVLIQAAAAFAFGAAASANQLAGIEGPGQAWAFAIVGCAAWAGAGLLGARAGWSWTFTPLGLAGSVIAAVVAGDAYGVLASVLALSVVAQVAAAAGSRRWSLLGTASAFAWLAVWAAWQWRDLENAYLSLVYAGFAAVEWAAFFTIRRHARLTTESGAVVFFLSWSSWTTAAVASGFVLGQRGRDLDPNTSIETTTEWTLAAAVLAMASAAVMAEGFRLARRPVWMTASAGLLVALLMAIATREPSNVQAYTAPIGVYLIVMAFTYRHTAPIIDPHLQLHEAVMVVGALFLVLPPASQSFDPDGGVYGLELIGIGIAMLLGGLALHGRWLVASALVTITATAGRLVTGGYFAVPYWALLGVAGTALIAAGLLILSLRAAWDRFRLAVVEWWNTAAPRGPLLPPSA